MKQLEDYSYALQYMQDYGLSSREARDMLHLALSGKVDLDEILEEMKETDLSNAIQNSGIQTYDFNQTAELQAKDFINENKDISGLTYINSFRARITAAGALNLLANKASSDFSDLSPVEAFLQHTGLHKYVSATDADEMLKGRAVPDTNIISFLHPFLRSVCKTKIFAANCVAEAKYKKLIVASIPNDSMHYSLHPAILSLKLEMYPLLASVPLLEISAHFNEGTSRCYPVHSWMDPLDSRCPPPEVAAEFAILAKRPDLSVKWSRKAAQVNALKYLSTHEYKKIAEEENKLQKALEIIDNPATLIQLWANTLCSSQKEFQERAALPVEVTKPSRRHQNPLSIDTQQRIHAFAIQNSPSSAADVRFDARVIGHFCIIAARKRDPMMPLDAKGISSLPWSDQLESWRNLIAMSQLDFGDRILSSFGKKDRNDYRQALNGRIQTRKNSSPESPITMAADDFLTKVNAVIYENAKHFEGSLYQFGRREQNALRSAGLSAWEAYKNQIASNRSDAAPLPIDVEEIVAQNWAGQIECWRKLTGMKQSEFGDLIFMHFGKHGNPALDYRQALIGRIQTRKNGNIHSPITMAADDFLETVIKIICNQTKHLSNSPLEFGELAKEALRASGMRAWTDYQGKMISARSSSAEILANTKGLKKVKNKRPSIGSDYQTLTLGE